MTVGEIAAMVGWIVGEMPVVRRGEVRHTRTHPSQTTRRMGYLNFKSKTKSLVGSPRNEAAIGRAEF